MSSVFFVPSSELLLGLKSRYLSVKDDSNAENEIESMGCREYKRERKILGKKWCVSSEKVVSDKKKRAGCFL